MTQGGWSNGNVTRVVIVEGGVFTGLFFYSPAIGPGNLIGSWTAAAGTDPYGNSYPAGINVGRPTGTRVQLLTFGSDDEGILRLEPPPSLPDVANGSLVDLIPWPVANPTFARLRLFPVTSSLAAADLVTLQLLSYASDGSQTSQVEVDWDGPTGASATYWTVGCAGMAGTGAMTAAEPGTGTDPTNPAVAETWHTPALTNPALWTTSGAPQPVRYRFQPDGTVRLDGELFTTGTGPWPPNATIFSLTAGYIPAQPKPFITRSDIAVAAGQCTVNVLSSGSVQNGQTFTASGQRLFFDGITFPVT